MFGSTRDSCSDGEATEKNLHDELARKGEDDNVEADKGEILPAFAISKRGRGIVGKRVGYEQGGVIWVGGRGIISIGAHDGDDDDERVEPGMS